VLWLVAPALLIAGAVALTAAIRSVESARRGLQAQVDALGRVRATIEPVQRHISATRATAVARARR